jgi:hypothetical protein
MSKSNTCSATLSSYTYLSIKYIVSGSSAGICLKTQLVRGRRVAGDELGSDGGESPDSDDSNSKGAE